MRLLFLAAALVAAPAFAQTTGLPDLTFGTAGVVTLDPSGALDSGALDVAVLPDGRVLLAGRTGADALVVRLTAAGALDASFGAGGVVRLPFEGLRAVFTALAVLPDGRVLAAGATQDGDDTAAGSLLVRLTPAGALDASFGTAGVVREGVADISAVQDLAVLPDGRIVVVGQFEDAAAGESRFAAVRYLAGGGRDATFGTDGRAAPAAVTASADALALDGLGRLLVTGSAFVEGGFFETEIQTARLTEAGVLDASFGSGGIAAAALPAGFNLASGIAVDPTGRPTVAGGALQPFAGTADLVLLRYTPAGRPDATFGTAGVVRTSAIGTAAIAFDLALQADGKILAGGAAGLGSSGDLLLARFTEAGAIDASFGTGGRTLIDLGDNDVAGALAFEANGRVVLAGQTGNADGSATQLAAVRITTDGRPTAGEDAADAGTLALSAAPNPFGASTRIGLSLGEAGPARVAVYDALGRLVAVLHDGPLAAGERTFRLDGAALAPGLYVVRAEGAAGAASVRVVRR